MNKPLCCRCVFIFNCGGTSYSRVLRNGNTCNSFRQVHIHDDDDYNKSVIERSDYIAKKAHSNCPEYRTDIFL